MKKIVTGSCSLPLLVLALFVSLIVGCSSATDETVANLSRETVKARLNKLPSSLINSDLFNTSVIEPTQLFDNLYFVGYVSVGTFVIDTSQGIVLIDTMWTPHDAENVIVPGIKKLGLTPEEIKYVIITHGHSDHYGGAHYFENKYGAEILMRDEEWSYIHDPEAPVLTDPFGNLSTEIPSPTSYTPVSDGQTIAFGDTTLTILATPGHTPGGMSLIMKVTNNGEPHTVALWGGTGLPDTKKANQSYLSSLNYFQKVANERQADVTLSNHPFSKDLIKNMDLLRKQPSRKPNPLVIGNKRLNDYIDSELRESVEEKLSSFE